jgi:CBS domain-containing protein
MTDDVTPSQAEGDLDAVEETLRRERERRRRAGGATTAPGGETMARKVGDVMTRGVEVVRPDDTVKHAAVMMEAHEVGPLPVCDGERLIGMLTDRDITVRAVAAGRDPSSTTVRETMTAEDVAYVFEDQDVDEAVALMNDRQVRRLPVVSREKRLVGILALADIARGADENAQAEALQGVSQPTETQQTTR